MPDFTRRGFFAASAGLVAGLSPTAGAVEPISRQAGQRRRLSLSAYSMRGQFRNGELDMPGFVDWAATLDLDGVELTSYFFPEKIGGMYLAELKRRCHLNGLDITGGAIGNNVTLPDGEKLDKQFQHIRRWAWHYERLGAPVNRVFAGHPPEGTSESEAIRRCIPNLEKACAQSAEHGVMLAIENHDFLTDPERFMEVVKSVDSPWFGVSLDTGNFDARDPYKAMAEAAPYAVNVQVKIHTRPKGKAHQPTDFKQVARILSDAGYAGPVALEYEADEPEKEIPRYLDKLGNALASVA
jgi:sugar phosphate isomerase/epimerase